MVLTGDKVVGEEGYRKGSHDDISDGQINQKIIAKFL